MPFSLNPKTLTLPSVALVYGRGIEGCGVTRWGAELQSWMRSRGFQCDIFAYGKKKFLRGDAQQIDYSTFSGGDASDVVLALNGYDLVLYASVPVPKTEATELEAFYRLVAEPTNPIKVFFSFENTIALLKKTPYLPFVINRVDQVHGLQCRESSWLGEQCLLLNKTLRPVKNWMDFEKFERVRTATSWNERKNEIVYLGRNATFKRLPLTLELMRLANQHLEMKCTFRGVEAGFATMEWLKREPGITYHYDDEHIAPWAPNGPIHFWNSYKYEGGMCALAAAKFGISLCHIEPVDGEGINHMEYAMMEMIALGTVPLFHRDWLSSTVLDDGLITYADYNADHPFCIPVNPENLDAAIAAMKEITPRQAARMTQNGMNLLLREYGADYHIPNQLKLIQARGKALIDPEAEEDVVQQFTDNERYVTTALEAHGALHTFSDFEKQRVRVVVKDKQKMLVVETHTKKDFR